MEISSRRNLPENRRASRFISQSTALQLSRHRYQRFSHTWHADGIFGVANSPASWPSSMHTADFRVISWIFKRGAISKRFVCLRFRELTSSNNFACAPLSAYSGQIGMQLFWDCRGECPRMFTWPRCSLSPCSRKLQSNIAGQLRAPEHLNSRNNALIVLATP